MRARPIPSVPFICWQGTVQFEETKECCICHWESLLRTASSLSDHRSKCSSTWMVHGRRFLCAIKYAENDRCACFSNLFLFFFLLFSARRFFFARWLLSENKRADLDCVRTCLWQVCKVGKRSHVGKIKDCTNRKVTFIFRIKKNDEKIFTNLSFPFHRC